MRAVCWNYVGVVCYWLLLAFSCLFHPVSCHDYREKACPGGTEDSPPVDVTLSCPAGEVVSLGEAVVGRNKFLSCMLTDGDCTDKTDAFKKCEGQPNCTIKFVRPLSPNCGYITFIIVTYDCRAATAAPSTLVTQQEFTSPFPASGRVTAGVTRVHTSVKPAAKTPKEDNTGLIVGCVLAVVVTIILLIVAITMVVRRLACGMEQSADEEKKSTNCPILPCVGTDGSENGSKSGQQGEGREGEGRKRKKRRWIPRIRSSDKSQSMSPRLAPVGQEDEEEGTLPQTKPNSSGSTTDASGAADSLVMTGRSSARSSVAMDASATSLKRHSGDAKALAAVRRSWADDGTLAAGSGGGGLEGLRTGAVGDREVKTAHRKSMGNSAVVVGGGGERGVVMVDVNRMKTTAPTADRVNRNSEADAMMLGDAARIQQPQQQQASGRVYKAGFDGTGVKTDASGPVPPVKKRPHFDAVSVPNTETFTSC